MSDNEIGGFSPYSDGSGWESTPEGPATLVDGLKANQSVQHLDASGNKLGPEGGKAIAKALKTNSLAAGSSEVSEAGLLLRHGLLGFLLGGLFLAAGTGEVGEAGLLLGYGLLGCLLLGGLFLTAAGIGEITLDSIVIGSKDKPATIPLKELRENSIDALDFKGKELLAEGGIVLASALKGNSSVTKVSN